MSDSVPERIAGLEGALAVGYEFESFLLVEWSPRVTIALRARVL
jgi:hypothetical protein